jgi:hypothetical protein
MPLKNALAGANAVSFAGESQTAKWVGFYGTDVI